MNNYFSIIIPTYNRAEIISQAIESVLNQNYQNWELIIIDDGSHDHTKKIVNSFLDKRIKYFYQENKERSAARNKGIEMAAGNYTCFLDSDDKYVQDYLTNLNSFLIKESNPDCLVRCNSILNVENKNLKTNTNTIKFSSTIDRFLKEFSPLCAICVSTIILKKNKFEETLKYAEDTNLWMRIACQYPILFGDFDSCVINYRTSSSENVTIHLDYVKSFSITFSIPEVKKIVNRHTVNNLFERRLKWSIEISKKSKNFLIFIKSYILFICFKLKIVSFY
ncbi:MAG: glycosyltransferase family 2 protein [Sphingobacteriaceae bacterium]|nr:glycosyltransferase family 2 protein [Sphingobacteriaceae bacterium]